MAIDPYEKLRRAHRESRGTNLTAVDVDKLMDDTAIRDAVYQTYAEENGAGDDFRATQRVEG